MNNQLEYFLKTKNNKIMKSHRHMLLERITTWCVRDFWLLYTRTLQYFTFL